jgi:hypothetical protein
LSASEPLWSFLIYGAALSAELTGDSGKARDYYAKLIELCNRADAPTIGENERKELKKAKAVLARE